jgi:ribonuclease HII
MVQDLWVFERQIQKDGFARIAGVDEAGRGPLAGPVVAAAVVLPASFSVAGVTDSKKLSAKKRETLYEAIYTEADGVGVGIVDAGEIDRINILRASLLAMAKAVDALAMAPDYLLIDGTFQIESPLPQKAITKGDSLSISIAAASIIAKVTRDRLMADYHILYPEYNFGKHKGYPTKAHRDAIKIHGCCPIHRKTFKGAKEYSF